MCQDTDSDQAARQRAFDVLYEGTPLWEIGRPQGEVVRLYDLECRPVEQVAQLLECSPGAVYMRRARARDMLREILGEFSNFV